MPTGSLDNKHLKHMSLKKSISGCKFNATWDFGRLPGNCRALLMQEICRMHDSCSI